MTDAMPLAIRLDGVTKRFGKNDVLHQISWEVPQGHIVGLLGLNGAGKTTLLRVLMGMLRVSEGEAAVAGQSITANPAAVRERVGYVPERTHIPGGFTADRLEAVGRRTFPEWDAAQYASVLERFRVGRDKPVYLMSQGQRTLTSLAFALAHHAQVLLLDEPTNGLDPLVRRDFLTNVIEESYDQGRTVIVSSHLLDEVAQIAQDIAILHHGALVAEGSLDDLLSKDRMVSLRDDADTTWDWSSVAGVRVVARQDKQVSLYVRDFDEAAVQQAMRQQSVSDWTVRAVSLEEFFEERVRSDAS